jgi:putative FmdB family regulatory protein
VPTYQYSCTECGHFFEAFQSFSDDSLTVCPECGGRLRKVFNAVGVVFKGSGFYRNDSRGQKAGAEAGSTSNGSGDSGKSSDSGKSGDSGTTKISQSTTSTSGTASTTPSPA